MKSELNLGELLEHLANPQDLDSFLSANAHKCMTQALNSAFHTLKNYPSADQLCTTLVRHWNKNNCFGDLTFVFVLCGSNNWVQSADELLNTNAIADEGLLRAMEFACDRCHTEFLSYMIKKSDDVGQNVNLPALLVRLMKNSSNRDGHNALKKILSLQTVDEPLDEVLLQTLAHSNLLSSKLLFPYVDAAKVAREYKQKWYATTDMETWFEKAYANYQKSILKKSLPKSAKSLTKQGCIKRRM